MLEFDSRDPLAPLYNKAGEVVEVLNSMNSLTDDQARKLQGALPSLMMWEALRIRIGGKPSTVIMAEEMMGVTKKMEEKSLAMNGDRPIIRVSSSIDCFSLSRRIIRSIKKKHNLEIKYDIFAALCKILANEIYSELEATLDD
jgi:hypothetical protein